ncbi:MAG: sialate O-acetylesterase [Planctomycetota bacterium]
MKVFVLAGQSNMVGKRCRKGELPEELQKEQPGAFFFTGTEWVPVAPGKTEKRGFGPELSFAKKTSSSLGETIGIVKLSVGGTSLSVNWAPDREGSLYAKLKDLVGKAAASRKIEVAGMLWMQGGADAKNEGRAKAYAENLENFIKKAREDFGNPDMVFVCGRSAAPVKKYRHIAHVRKAQEGVTLPGYAWIDHDNIPMGRDKVHYSTEGQVKAGYMFADAMLKLLKAQSEGKTTPDK